MYVEVYVDVCSIPQGDRVCVGELQYQCQEYHTLLQAANVERDRLSELVEVTQKRLVSQHRLLLCCLLCSAWEGVQVQFSSGCYMCST